MTRTCLSYNKARCQQVYLSALSVGRPHLGGVQEELMIQHA